jgi:hypothetical protein
MKEVYRYRFSPSVVLKDVEASLQLAIVSVEALHGEAQARLDIQYLLDVETRSCVVDASTSAGRDLNKVFAGYLCREFREGSFSVDRMSTPDLQ